MAECRGCAHAGEDHFSRRVYAGASFGENANRTGNCRYCCRNKKNKSKGYDHYQSKADVARLRAVKRGWGQGAKDDGYHRPGQPHPTRKERKLLKSEKK